MNWIKKFNQGIYQIYSGNVLEAFQPLDFFHYYPLWYDLWLKRIILVMDALKLDTKNFQEIQSLLPTPSSLRSLTQKIMPSYQAFVIKDATEIKRVTNFFIRMLEESCPADPFAENSSPLHRPDEINSLLSSLPWQTGSISAARICGRLVAASGSLAHGLYDDLVTDFGWDNYGPYQTAEGELLITHFPDLQTPELWGKPYRASVKEIIIYRLYKNVHWKLSGVGCHTTLLSGDPILGLTKYLVKADDNVLTEESVAALINELAAKAELIYREIRNKNFEELKAMVMLQECYQLKKLFDAAKIDWRPTDEMKQRVKNKPLLTGLIPHGKMVTSIKEYEKMFGINIFAREVFGIELE